MYHFFFLIILFTLPIQSYTPGRWSYKDKYVLEKGNVGPTKEIVRNGEGVVIYVAEYFYDEDGHLIQENYSNKEGNSDGKTIYTYKAGLITTEEIFNSFQALLEKKEFIYKNFILKRLVTKDAEGNVQINYILELDKHGQVISGEGKNYESNDLEAFRFVQDPKRTNIQIQYLLDDKKRPLGEIHFKYDGKGNLVEREFFQGDTKRVNKLKYNAGGLLEKYSFHVKQNETWNIEKTHFLIYEGKTSRTKLSIKD